uniref:Uncharacterized protein n=1 Tax=Arundo donax TaxID=35708 RepID=A0A0A9GVE1_ARUDO
MASFRQNSHLLILLRQLQFPRNRYQSVSASCDL